MAIADLIDNCISAEATAISIDYDWNAGRPWVRILDNGHGMTEEVLKNAMRLGSQSPLDPRMSSDLGRFGLGMKTASFSQCKHLTVRTKIERGEVSTRCWDLDHVRLSKKWELSLEPRDDAGEILSLIGSLSHGTVVLWQNFHRLEASESNDTDDSEALWLERFRPVVKCLEMVFHQFLSGQNPITISVGRHKCEPWDPFLRSNKFTQRLSSETLSDGKVQIQPYVLPHVSNRSAEESASGAGVSGWNAHQGFYLYRNRRMIISGGYLGLEFTPEEHYKLCRISVDLPNDLDEEWSINVTKAFSSPPLHIRADLERIVKATRAQAVKIYRARTGPATSVRRLPQKHDIWLKKKRGDKILYEINRDNEAIRRILDEVDLKSAWIRKLFHIIERSVPHRLIVMDSREHEDCHVDFPVNVALPPKELLEMCETFFREKVKEGMDPGQAADYACAFFDDHVSYRVMLDELLEDLK